MLLCFGLLVVFSAGGCAKGPGDDATAREYFDKAYQFVDAGYPKEAIDLLGLAIQKDPRFVDAYYNRGVLYFVLKDYRLALRDFNRTVELNPGLAAGYAGRGSAYARLNDEARATEDFKTAARLGHEDARRHLASQGIAW